MLSRAHHPLVLGLLVAAGPIAAGSPARAAGAEGFELQASTPSPAGDRFFLAPGGAVGGDSTPYVRLLAGYTYKPLFQRSGSEVVSSQLLVDLGAAYAIDRRWLFGLDLPFVAAQSGNDPASPSGAALGDLRIAARAGLIRNEAFSFGPEARLWLPTGSQDALAGDGAVRASFHLAASGRASAFVYAASAGYLARKNRDVCIAPCLAGPRKIGPALPFAAAAGVVVADDRLQIGPELQGQFVFEDAASTPIIGLLGVRYRAGNFVMGVTAGPGLTKVPGVSPRVNLSLAWEPESERSAPSTEPEPTAEPKEKPEAAEPPPLPEPPPPPNAEPAPPPPAAPTAAPLSDEEARAQARRAFADGVKAFDEARFGDAAEAFSKAYALKPHATVLRNLAQSELMAGKLEPACEHFKKWKAEAKNAPAADLKQVEDGISRSCR